MLNHEKNTAECEEPGGNFAALRDGVSPAVSAELGIRSEHDGFSAPQRRGPLPSNEAIQREISVVRNLRISPPLQDWIDRYEQVGERDVFLWKWCRRGVEVTTLPCVPQEYRDELGDTKVLGVMLDVLLDDVADEQGDNRYLEYLLHLVGDGPQTTFAGMTARQQDYAEFTAAVWDEIQRRIARYPRHAEFAELIQFDYQQLWNTMRYSRLLNSDPALLNMTEHDLYLPHNMHMMVSSTMDLMCSPGFDHSELGALREVVWRAQYMGRIGNLVTTWEREIGERDFTSGVFASAVSAGDVTAAELAAGDRERISRTIQSRGHEEVFLQRWETCRNELLMLQPRLQSVNVAELTAGLDRLICLHLGSRGAK